MADQSDVRTALITTLGAAIVPNGNGVAISGQTIKIEPGWPTSALLAQLNNLGDPVSTAITVYPDPAMSRNTTRYNDAGQFLDVGGLTSTMGVTIADPVVTFTGTPAVGQAVGIALRSATSGTVSTYGYRVLLGATLASVAAAVAALVPGATASAAAVTFPGHLPISAAVMMDGQACMQPVRMEDMFHICVWTATPQDRDSLTAATFQALAPLTFLTLPDGSVGRIKFHGRSSTDKSERSLVYWADLKFTVEYAMTIFETLARALFVTTTINNSTTLVADTPAH
jgi:hypothetical protein